MARDPFPLSARGRLRAFGFGFGATWRKVGRTLFGLIGIAVFWAVGAAPLALGLSAEGEMVRGWLTVSDPAELRRTWSEAAVRLPRTVSRDAPRRPVKSARLDQAVAAAFPGKRLPVILYLHSCEGLGHHREDLERFAKLGFVVIAPDSNARHVQRLGCHEDGERYTRYFDLAAAFRKAELGYALGRLEQFDWIDRRNLFLVGSGLGGMVAAQYEGTTFAGLVIEGWGCRGPNPMFDGIWAPPGVRVFSAVSRNDPWFQKNPGFAVDCASFIAERTDGVAVVLERPAHYVSWYPKARAALIRFLTENLDVDADALVADTPEVVKSSPDGIMLRERWWAETVYAEARRHCATHGKRSHLSAPPDDGLYAFVCE